MNHIFSFRYSLLLIIFGIRVLISFGEGDGTNFGIGFLMGNTLEHRWIKPT